MNKTKIIKFRADAFEEKLIKVKAKESGLSLSDYVRRCALNRTLPKILTTEELEIYKDLKKYHQNFASIGNLFKKGEYPTLVSEIKKVKKELSEHLKIIANGK